jgi:hypothetical protein
MTLRVRNEEQAKKFERFNHELKTLGEIDPLRELGVRSPHVLQVIAFHLTFEYLIEKWIDYKVNSGSSVFSGIEKIGFHNKLYIAKNIGLPKKIFHALNKINDERNRFAHQISRTSLSEKEILEIAGMADAIESTGGQFADLGIYDGALLVNSETAACERGLLLLALHALLGKVRNFVFTDIHLSTSQSLR